MAVIPAYGADATVNLGDLISGPFDPAGSADAQMKSGYLTIAGNHDRQLMDKSEAALDVLSRPLLSPDHWVWIRSLPATLTLADGEMSACHGSPAGGDLEYLLEDVSSGRAVLDTEDAILARLAGIGERSGRSVRAYPYATHRNCRRGPGGEPRQRGYAEVSRPRTRAACHGIR